MHLIRQRIGDDAYCDKLNWYSDILSRNLCIGVDLECNRGIR